MVKVFDFVKWPKPFSGSIDLDSKLYELIYTYVRNVELIDPIDIDGIDFNVLNSNILLSEF